MNGIGREEDVSNLKPFWPWLISTVGSLNEEFTAGPVQPDVVRTRLVSPSSQVLNRGEWVVAVVVMGVSVLS